MVRLINLNTSLHCYKSIINHFPRPSLSPASIQRACPISCIGLRLSLTLIAVRHENYPSGHKYAARCGDLWRTLMASYDARPFKKLNYGHLRGLLLFEGLVSCVLMSVTHPNRYKHHKKMWKIAYKFSLMPTSSFYFYIFFKNRRSYFFLFRTLSTLLICQGL